MKVKQLLETQDIDLSKKQLKVLPAGLPKKVGGDFYCHDNQLKSLEGAPSQVGGSFLCHYNRLKSLEGAPVQVGGSFWCHNNQLTSLEGVPSNLGGDFYCHNNQLTSLKNVHKHIKQINGAFVAHSNQIEDGWLHLLMIKGITEVMTGADDFDEVVNDYLKSNPSGSMKAVLDVQELLIQADLEEYAE